MMRTTSVLALAAVVLVAAGCGVGNDFPLIQDDTIVVTASTETTISITWTPAANEPGVGKGYLYEVYTSSGSIVAENDLNEATLHLTGTATDLGEELSSATITGLASGSGYHINVAAVNQRSGELELYAGVLGITKGGSSVTDTYTGAVPYFNHTGAGSGASTVIDYSIDLGATPSDVYLVFSNPAQTTTTRPEIVPGSIHDPGFSWSADGAQTAVTPEQSGSGFPAGPVILRDRPETLGWQPPELRGVARAAAPPPLPPSYDTEDVSKATFHDDAATTILATCRKVVTWITEVPELPDPPITTTLNIWVQDSEWSELTVAPAGKINDAMVTFLADSFLAENLDNDIYDWLTNVYGDEWGPHPYGNLITDNNEITILLWDIGGDGQAGGVVGYFWSKDNFLASDIPFSNERVMFYLDSASLGTGDGAWNPTDYWPTEMVATLAHEFQHMINYYQRGIVLNVESQTWLNEMMSMASEGLVGNKLYVEQGLDIAGPRGVQPSWGGGTGGAGDPNNGYGRLPLYNAAPSISLTTWLSGPDVLKSYSIGYAFGAFLARSYGGAPLLGAMMSRNSSDPESVLSEAIATVTPGLDLSIAELLWRWGVAVLLSDDDLAPADLRLNGGSWATSTVDTTTYDLGSVNHFNYDQEGSAGDGPRIHTSTSYTLLEMQETSTVFYRLAENQTGVLSAALLIPNGVGYTVVVK